MDIMAGKFHENVRLDPIKRNDRKTGYQLCAVIYIYNVFNKKHCGDLRMWNVEKPHHKPNNELYFMSIKINKLCFPNHRPVQKVRRIVAGYIEQFVFSKHATQ